MFNVFVTNRCNLSCKYCYEGKEKLQNSFTSKKIDLLIKFMEKYNVRGDSVPVNFHGGEPLLEIECIEEISKRVKEKYKCSGLSVTTNGTIMSEKIARVLIEYGMEITVSIDGRKETHDRYRKYHDGRGSHDIVMKNIKFLQEMGATNLRYRLTFDSETVKDLAENVKYLAENNIKNVVPSPDYFDTKWNDEAIEIFKENILKLRKYKERNQDKLLYIPYTDGNEIRLKGPCRGGIGSYHINANGDVYPCSIVVGDPKYKIGSLKGGIDNKKIEQLKCIYERKVDDCIGCNYSPYCIGSRCKFINEKIGRALYKAVPVVCELENVMYKYVFLYR